MWQRSTNMGLPPFENPNVVSLLPSYPFSITYLEIHPGRKSSHKFLIFIHVANPWVDIGSVHQYPHLQASCISFTISSTLTFSLTLNCSHKIHISFHYITMSWDIGFVQQEPFTHTLPLMAFFNTCLFITNCATLIIGTCIIQPWVFSAKPLSFLPITIVTAVYFTSELFLSWVTSEVSPNSVQLPLHFCSLPLKGKSHACCWKNSSSLS